MTTLSAILAALLVIAFFAFTIVIFFMLVALLISIYFNVKHGKIIISVEDAIEESLDVLDERYRSVSKILETDIFFDSYEVRQCVEEIRQSQEAILYVANALSKIDSSGLIEEGE